MKKITSIVLAVIMLSAALFCVSANAADDAFENVSFDWYAYAGAIISNAGNVDKLVTDDPQTYDFHPELPGADIVGFYGWAQLKSGKIKKFGCKLDNGAMQDSALSKDQGLDRTAELASFPNAEGFWIVFYYTDLKAGKHTASFYAIGEDNKEYEMFSYEFKINGADDPATPMRVNTCIDSQDANYKNIAVAGWTGFNYEVEEFGYKVDDNKPVFDGSITLTELADDDPVKYPNNGGANGVRFSMDMNAEKLWATTGNHKFAIVARLKDEAKTVMVVHEYPELYVAEVVEGGGQQPDDYPGEQGGATQPTNPGTADVSVIAIASLACVALAGIVIAKKIR